MPEPTAILVPVASTKKKTTGGRRRNYEPKVELTGIKKFLPTGWANWLGFSLFGGLGIAFLIEGFIAIGRLPKHLDMIPAFVLTVLCLWIAYLFAITRWKDYI